MGWCDATEVMDVALDAAEQLLLDLRSDTKTSPNPERVNDVLSPYVARIAELLRDADWDCVEQSRHFHRFRREMLGYDRHEMLDWYRDRLRDEEDPTRFREYADEAERLLTELRDRARTADLTTPSTDRSTVKETPLEER